jgi:hypothetical protein
MSSARERIALALVLCVPVPALALSGLTIPLPSVVERIAAALVPFDGGVVLEDESALATGRIVHVASVGRAAPAKSPRTTAARKSQVARGVKAGPTVTTQPAHRAASRPPAAKATTGATLEEHVTTAVTPTRPEPASLPAPAPAPAPTTERPKEPTRTTTTPKEPDASLEPVEDVVDELPIVEPVVDAVTEVVSVLEKPPEEEPKRKDLLDPVRDLADRLGS